MATLALRAPRTAKRWTLRGGFARIATVVAVVIDVFADAQRRAHEAQQRYPFTVWKERR